MILPVLVCAENKKIMLSQRREFCSGCETFCANERRTELVPALPSAAKLGHLCTYFHTVAYHIDYTNYVIINMLYSI